MNNEKLNIAVFVEHRTLNVELLPSPVPSHQSMIIEHSEHSSIRAFRAIEQSSNL